MSRHLDEPSSASDVKLEHVLAEYLRSADRGENPDRQALLDAHPDLTAELRSFFHNQDALQKMAAPLRAAALDATLPGRDQTAPAPGTLLRYFGDYELLAEIARGGMGVVYKARQVSLNRIVALKMILAGQLASPEDVERFHLEAEAAANLDHPGIVPIYEVGEHEGQHFFSMAFVDGPSLAQRLTEGPLPPLQAAELIRQVAEAVAFAHARGVIHRDLKPGNILLAADGQPRITDFGLAKRIAGEKHLTATGQVLGTPSFMPPEQAAGDGGQIDGTADVYALGAVLYALLVGRPPFQADNPIDTVLQVLYRDAVAPRQLNARIPRDLETICLKCLRKTPWRRYADAAALADDLQRFLNHRPIHARPVGVVERTAKWVRRRPALAALMVVAVAGFGGVTWEWRAATRERRTVERLLDTSEAQRYLNQIGWADRESADGYLDRAESILLQCPVQRRGWEWRYLQRLCHPELLSIETGVANSVAFSPDGALLAVPSNGSMPRRAGDPRTSDKCVMVFDAATGKRVWTSADHKHHVLTARFSRDGEWLISAGGILAADGKGEGEVQLQRLKSDVVSLTYSNHASWVQSAEMHPDGLRVASIDQSGTIRLWSAADGADIASFKIPAAGFSCGLAFDRRGERLAAVSSGSDRVYVWKLDSPEQPTEYVGLHYNILGNVDFSPDGRLLAAGDMNNTVIVWDVATGAVKHRLADAGREVRFSPDGAQLATTDVRIDKQDKALRIWDLAEERLLRRLPGGFNCLDYAVDGKRVASASFGGTVRIWDRNATPGLRRLNVQTFAWGGLFGFVGEGPTIVVPDTEARFVEKTPSPGGSSVHSYGRRTIAFWNTNRGEQERHVVLDQQQDFAIRDLAVSADRRWFVTVESWNGRDSDPPCKVTIRDAETGDIKKEFERPAADSLQTVAIHPSGDRIAVGAGKERVEVIRASDGKQLFWIRVWAQDLAFSPDGRLLATASRDRRPGHVDLWSAETGKYVRNLSISAFGYPSSVMKIAFSPDGNYLAGACQHNDHASDFVTVCELATGATKYTLRGHTGEITALAFSPNGNRLVSAAKDETLILWEMNLGQRILTLPSAVGKITCVEFSPAGNQLAALGNGLQLWDAPR